MISFFRYQRNGLPYGLITIHEFLVRDIFRYFEKARLFKKKPETPAKPSTPRCDLPGKRDEYPSKKTAEVLDALGQMQDELEYTHKVIVTAFEEAETIINLIKQEKVGEIIPLVEEARARFKNHDIEGGMEQLKAAQENMKNKFLLKSRKATLGGLDSHIKELKHELMGREKR